MVLELISYALGCDAILSIGSIDLNVLLACVISWLPDGSFGIVSMKQGIVKSS